MRFYAACQGWVGKKRINSHYLEMDREYFNTRREERRQKFKELLGGKCDSCAAEDGLQFDHKNPKKKEFRISLHIDAPDNVLEKEVKKCRLLCDTCHKEKTLNKQEYGKESKHGTIWRYKKHKCRCKKCKDAMSKYNRKRRKKLLREASSSIDYYRNDYYEVMIRNAAISIQYDTKSFSTFDAAKRWAEIWLEEAGLEWQEEPVDKPFAATPFRNKRVILGSSAPHPQGQLINLGLIKVYSEEDLPEGEKELSPHAQRTFVLLNKVDWLRDQQMEQAPYELGTAEVLSTTHIPEIYSLIMERHPILNSPEFDYDPFISSTRRKIKRYLTPIITYGGDKLLTLGELLVGMDELIDKGIITDIKPSKYWKQNA